jgi:D-serine deaminase-like pyridoxal phosphate-dependent protein
VHTAGMEPGDLLQLSTPAALIDERRLDRNIARMQAHVAALGVQFRPHVKTSKCVAVATRQRAAGAHGITVSTLKEAEQFHAAGFDDIFYAVGLAPHRAAQALALQRAGCQLTVVVDSLAAAEALVAAARADGASARVMIELDVDGHRAGVPPDAPLLVQLGRFLHTSGMDVRGVMAHAGSSYDCRDADARARCAEAERAGTVRGAERLRDAGLPCPVVSVGSTPTALSARSLAGVTEVRAGVYVFFDLVMMGLGVCTADDLALSVLATVIGHQAERGWVITDAGWTAMSRDRGTAGADPDPGYGLVCDVAGHVLDGWVLGTTNQEHGIVHRRDAVVGASVVERFPVGTKLRILPNHACATAGQHAAYHVVQDQRVRATWPRFGGW